MDHVQYDVYVLFDVYGTEGICRGQSDLPRVRLESLTCLAQADASTSVGATLGPSGTDGIPATAAATVADAFRRRSASGNSSRSRRPNVSRNLRVVSYRKGRP